MSIKRIFIVISAIFAVSAVFADNSSVTSKKYVDDLMSGYQGKLPGSGANTLMIYDDETGIGEKSIAASLGSDTSATSVPTVGAVKTGLNGKQDTITGTAGYVMTGTGYNGSVGEKPIYGTNVQYNSALVTAESVNTGVINAVNNSLIRVGTDGQPNPNGTLWEIQDDLIALNICSNYAPATGTGVQNGTPTPTNPILPTFYQQGDMILRRVGDYADSYDSTTNKITRRVGVKVLDGTESWTSMSNYTRFQCTVDDAVADANTRIFCSHYAYDAISATGNTCRMTTGGTFLINFSTAFSSKAAFLEYLAAQYAAGTPVVIYYPLETEIEEDVSPRCQ